jgi:gamma-glutamyltranspeptidase/glutathione hydrolase
MDLAGRHGRLPAKEILAPAIRLAEDGFPVAPVTAYFWARGAERQLAQAPNGAELTLDGRAPRAGEVFHNAGLARTLRTVAEGGAAAFYQGEIARAIVAVVRQAGGLLSEADLAAHVTTREEPLSVGYRGLRVWECPPNGQGLVALLALNILEGYPVADWPALGARRLHVLAEALRLAFADGYRHVADPAFYHPPLTDLLSPEYAAARRRSIDPQRARRVSAGRLASGTDTVYLSVVDSQGNACSLINSNYMGFGTGIVPRGWGFSLQNRGHNFSLDPEHPNALAPGKRPYHTIIPAMATRADGSLYASFGVMGGFMQPQGHVQVLMALADDGLDPQQALDRPRLCIGQELNPPELLLEAGIPRLTASALGRMGHMVKVIEGHGRAVFGRGQIIVRQAETGVLWGGSDGRADGCAAALI